MLTLALNKLIAQEDLTSEESASALAELIKNPLSPQAPAFLACLRAKGETVEELYGLVTALRSAMTPVAISHPVLDIVGTGGDGAHTLNISTASAIVAASLGVKVAKHGNRSVSSLCGSADVLEALGIKLDQSPDVIEKLGICFLFAPHFHQSLKTLKDVRRGLAVRTSFNILGPLLNPANPDHLMIGVFDLDTLPIVAELLQRLKTRRSFVFHGCGLDELSCIGPSHVIEVTPEGMRRFTLDPKEFGLKPCTIDDLKGKDAKYNAEKMLQTFAGEKGAFSDTIALNAGVALYLYGKAKTIAEGIEMAKDQTKALALIEKWRTYA